MVARGGRGGLGNTHFATATHRAPTHAQKGEPGEERKLQLELRLIADVGLVGLPNAGKSTLLGALTAATPQVASYPFTTLEPNLGVLDLSAVDPHDERRATIADMPGLIEGASAGAGLGHAFLRHVSRTRVLVHVVDLAAADPERDYQVIREELEAHDPTLLEKVTLVVGNKIDLPDADEQQGRVRQARARKRAWSSCAVSAAEGQGIDKLIAALARLLPDAATLAQPGEPAGVVVHRLESGPDLFSVRREDGVLPGHRPAGSSGWPPRRTSRTTNRRSASSATWPSWASRASWSRPASMRATRVLIGAVELEWDPDAFEGVRG